MTDSATVSYDNLSEILQRPRQSLYKITRLPAFPPPLPFGKRHKGWARAGVMDGLARNGQPDTPADNPLKRACRKAIADPATPDLVRDWLARLLAGDAPATTT